ncbi:hypothetical protein Tco_1239793 [Tanacetum coccineum]
MVPHPRSPTQSLVADEAASTGVDVRYGGATTIVTGLEAGQGSGNIDKTLTMPQDSPLLRVNTLGSDEGSLTLQELTVLCTTLSKKVESLETDLKQTKLIYGAAYKLYLCSVLRMSYVYAWIFLRDDDRSVVLTEVADTDFVDGITCILFGTDDSFLRIGFMGYNLVLHMSLKDILYSNINDLIGDDDRFVVLTEREIDGWLGLIFGCSLIEPTTGKPTKKNSRNRAFLFLFFRH